MLNHRLGLQSYIWKKHRTSATIYFGQMRPKSKCSQKPNKVYQHKQLKLTFSQSGGRGMFLVCDAAGDLTVIESTTNSSVYQSILESNVRPSVQWLKLGQNWGMQHYYDPKHNYNSNSTTEWLKNKRIKVFPWPSQTSTQIDKCSRQLCKNKLCKTQRTETLLQLDMVPQSDESMGVCKNIMWWEISQSPDCKRGEWRKLVVV